MIKKRSYPEIEITKEMFDEALVREKSIPQNLKNSILSGGGIFTGCIGEVAFQAYSGGEKCNTRDFDICLRNGKLCEVKTKKRKEKPMSSYECSISNYNTSQECDYYVFASTLLDFSKTWIVGFLPRDEFYKRAIFRAKGDVDPSNNQVCKAPCWNVKISETFDIKDLPNE